MLECIVPLQRGSGYIERAEMLAVKRRQVARGASCHRSAD
jgi:hypothetical protein